jgi:general secretion pathway protein A
MYLQHFGLSKPPFQLTPDFKFLYLSRPHARAIAYMKYAVMNHDGFTVVTGEIGSGKTILVQKLVSELDDSVLVARVHQTQLSEAEFLEEVAARLGLKQTVGKGKVELIERLNQFLIEQSATGKNILLIVDEAQNLKPSVLEEIRLLSDVEAFQQKVLSVILVGQPQLNEVLENPLLEQLEQRIRLRYHLRPLNLDETGEYMRHRLEVAGWSRGELFNPEVISHIYQYTGGVPRLVNVLCDTVLLATFVDGLDTVSTELVDSAVEELRWGTYEQRQQHHAEIAEHLEPVSALQGAHVEGAQQPRAHARLAILFKGRVLSTHLIKTPYVTIGRTTDNDIQFPHPSVSRHHAAVIMAGDHHMVVDLGSTNGTQVNAEPVTRQPLRHGDVVTVGRFQLRYAILRQEIGDQPPHHQPTHAIQEALDDTLTRFPAGNPEAIEELGQG